MRQGRSPVALVSRRRSPTGPDRRVDATRVVPATCPGTTGSPGRSQGVDPDPRAGRRRRRRSRRRSPRPCPRGEPGPALVGPDVGSRDGHHGDRQEHRDHAATQPRPAPGARHEATQRQGEDQGRGEEGDARRRLPGDQQDDAARTQRRGPDRSHEPVAGRRPLCHGVPPGGGGGPSRAARMVQGATGARRQGRAPLHGRRVPRRVQGAVHVGRPAWRRPAGGSSTNTHVVSASYPNPGSMA